MKKVILLTSLSIIVMCLIGLETINAQSFSGQATAIKSTVTIPGVTSSTTTVADTGPLPGAGGNISVTRVSANIPGILTAGSSNATTSGSGNSSQSTASVNNLNLTVLGINITAGVVSSTTQCTCTAGVPSCSGSSTITSLSIGGLPVTVTGAPNQTILLLGIGSIVINERTSTGSGDITVNALHIFVTDPLTGTTTDVIIASSHSDIDCSPSMPTTNTFSGRAIGIKSNVTTTLINGDQTGATTTIADTGNLPVSGGNISVSTATGNIPGLLTTGAISGETSGGGISSQSRAQVNNLSLSLLGNTITATVLEANTQCLCTINGPSCSGSSVIAGLVINGVSVTATGAPNQTIVLVVGTVTTTIILNEQTSTGSGDITVNALHVSVFDSLTNTSTDVVISSAHSDIQCLPVLAANVSIGGQVLNGKGYGIYRATVTLTDFNGMVRSVTTNPFGYYKFEEVSAGDTYVVSVRHKAFNFSPQVVTANEDLTALNFFANP